ncbi:MAG: GNAT family N-acetyltransferase [Oscillospiraceae bacterium]|nr:GNAT family N-acetyltransferase [Oscillospiraceae bacterium]
MDITGIDYLGLDRVLKRGTGTVLAESEDFMLVRDSVSGAYLLACEDVGRGLSLLDRCGGEDCKLLMTSNYALGQAAFGRYGFSGKLECYQVAYYGEKPQLRDELAVRTAEEEDLNLLAEHYQMISREELAAVVRRRSILLGYYRGRPVGFVGEHLEGSMGLLYVFPEFRRRGFGAALQRHFIARTLEAGFIPFGQVEKDNLNSLRLQRKLGMTQSDNLIVWMWK